VSIAYDSTLCYHGIKDLYSNKLYYLNQAKLPLAVFSLNNGGSSF